MKKPFTSQRGVLWNALGSGMYAASTVLLSFSTIRILGSYSGGIISIALTEGQILSHIVFFETRNYQNTDVGNEYQLVVYKRLKNLLSIVSIGIAILLTVIQGYTGEKALVFVMICLYRIIDGRADAYESELQHRNQLDVSGKSQFFRSILSVSVYCVFIYSSRQLLVSTIMLLFMAIVTDCLLAWRVTRLYSGDGKMKADLSDTLSLLMKCMPAAMGMLLWTIILSTSRICIDYMRSEDEVSYYQAIFLPISFFSLLTTFVFRPMLPYLTEQLKRREKKTIAGVIIKTIILIVTITMIGVVVGYTYGVSVIGMMTGLSLGPYRNAMGILLVSGGLNACTIILYYALLLFRNRKAIIIGYGTTSIISIIMGMLLVYRGGVMGGVISFFMSMVLLMVIFSLALSINLRRL